MLMFYFIICGLISVALLLSTFVALPALDVCSQELTYPVINRRKSTVKLTASFYSTIRGFTVRYSFTIKLIGNVVAR